MRGGISTLVFAVGAASTISGNSARAETLFAAYSSHTDKSCSSVAKQVAYVAKTGCTTANACTLDASGDTELYVTQDCVTDPKKRTAKLFSDKPWVQFEIYEPGSGCGTLASAVGYLADGSCLVADNATSSVVATVHANLSASIVTYEGTTCSGTPVAENLIAAADLQKTTCISGIFLAYTSEVATTTVVPASNDALSSGARILSAVALAVVATAVLLV